MGRKGGKAKTPKGFSALTPAQRSEAGKAAAAKRWADKNKSAIPLAYHKGLWHT
jgi:hypothetical protein